MCCVAGGFKSMKSRWLSEYEREQREREGSAQCTDSQATAHASALQHDGGGAGKAGPLQPEQPLARELHADEGAAQHAPGRPASARSVRLEPPGSSRLARVG
jgi:hypothetical protein